MSQKEHVETESPTPESFQIGVFVRGVSVVIDFGTPVKWFALSSEQALAFAALLTKSAHSVATKVITSE